MLVSDIAGVQALTLAIPLGTFIVVLFVAFFQRRSTR
jgi:fucose permease